MLNIPMLKLEKNNVYLNTQLEQQENNKQLILDIISNINLILNSVNNQDIENYQAIRESAYNFLDTISKNITSLEQLNIEIAGISKELENLQSEELKSTRTKEFYIVSFSNIKNNIAQYTEKFQSIQKKLEIDNNNFNEFINTNNFKYNFESIENDDTNLNTYKFTGFSIDNIDTKTPEVFEENTITEDLENGIDTQENTVTEVLENGIDSQENTISEVLENGIDTQENTVTEVLENGIDTQENTVAEVLENGIDSQENTVTEVLENGIDAQENTVSEVLENGIDSQENTISEVLENGIDSQENTVENEDNSKSANTIDELTDNFRKMLINLSNGDSNIEDTSKLISNYFKEIHELADSEIEKNDKISTNTEKETLNYAAIEGFETPSELEENIEIPETISEDIIDNNIENNYTEAFFEKPNILEETNSITNEELENTIINTEINNNITIPDLSSEENISNNDTEIKKDIISPIQEENINTDIKEDVISLNKEKEDTQINTLDEEKLQKELLKNKLEKIISASADNETLIISEKTNNIYLPYKIPELINYIDNYPDAYTSLSDVVAQEFILPFDYFMKHPYKSRFFETYNLMRNRQGNSVLSSIRYGLKLMGRSNLNPAIIASCKSEDELKTYLYYLDSNRLSEFKAFNIIYQVNPL